MLWDYLTALDNLKEIILICTLWKMTFCVLVCVREAYFKQRRCHSECDLCCWVSLK